MIRDVAAALLGFVVGACLGIAATLIVIWLWFDILAQDGDGPKPGLDWLFTLGPVLTLGGGIAMACWAVWRQRRGRGPKMLAVAGVVGLGVMLVCSISLFH